MGYTLFCAGLVLSIGAGWGSTGAISGEGLGPVLGLILVLVLGQKRRVHWIFSNALFHFPKVKINGQTAIFQGIVSECLK